MLILDEYIYILDHSLYINLEINNYFCKRFFIFEILTKKSS